jgi:hypothetical protein
MSFRYAFILGLFAVLLIPSAHADNSDHFDDTDLRGTVIPYLEERILEQAENLNLPPQVIERLSLPTEERKGVTLIQVGENLQTSIRQTGDQIYEDTVIFQSGSDIQQNLVAGPSAENNRALFFQLGQFGPNTTIIQASSEEVAEIAIEQDADPTTYEFTPADNLGGNAPVVVTYDDSGLNLAYDNGEARLLGGELQRTDIRAVNNVAVIAQGFSVDGVATENGSFFDDLDHPQEPTDEPQDALIIQAGEESLAFISQVGAGNISLILQNGDFNRAKAFQMLDDETQSEPGNLSLLAQIGDYNTASVYQVGTGHSSFVFQLGGGNTAVVEQRAATGGASAFIYQSGAVEATGYGQGNFASVLQAGQ